MKKKKADNSQDKKIRELVLSIINEVDYDIAKSFDPELSEDPEYSEMQMKRLVRLVKKALPGLVVKDEDPNLSIDLCTCGVCKSCMGM